MLQIEVGYLEATEKWRLESPHFPSKTGGKPSWLALADFPTFEDLQCETCKKQMIFLCQIYAPFQESDDNFHRTLFIFICKTTSCNVKHSSSNYRVFRSNLPRDNKFYPNEPAPEGEVVMETSRWVNLCSLCGCPGNKRCSKCKSFYCCREHQVIHWKESHKGTCGTNEENPVSKYLYPEFEIKIESDGNSTDEDDDDEGKTLEDFKVLKAFGTLPEADESELEKFANCEEDEVFNKFKELIKSSPSQILRYNWSGKPLWITQEQPNNIPNCDYCGARRIFECQIMPQLLVALEMDYDLEFGILAIYTCEKSCGKEGYKKEYIFKQSSPTEGGNEVKN